MIQTNFLPCPFGSLYRCMSDWCIVQRRNTRIQGGGKSIVERAMFCRLPPRLPPALPSPAPAVPRRRPGPPALHPGQHDFRRSMSIATSVHLDNDVEDLEMLLEAYFKQLDGIRNRILSVREYIDDTEDYVNIQLGNQRNELIQLQLTLTIASFGIAVNTFIAGAFAMNFPCNLYDIADGSLFRPFVRGTSLGCFVVLILLLGYAWWKKLLGP